MSPSGAVFATTDRVELDENAKETFVLKCDSTVISMSDYERQDGLHRFATWKDKFGYHTNVPLILNGTSPNHDGLLQSSYFFSEQNSEGEANGSSLIISIIPKADKVNYILTNVKFNGTSGAKNLSMTGSCQYTDHSKGAN